MECPTGSGTYLTINQVAEETARRLARIFLQGRGRQTAGVRRQRQVQNDPHFRDHVLFYEYFHGDNGRGVGAYPPDRLDRRSSPA